MMRIVRKNGVYNHIVGMRLKISCRPKFEFEVFEVMQSFSDSQKIEIQHIIRDLTSLSLICTIFNILLRNPEVGRRKKSPPKHELLIPLNNL